MELIQKTLKHITTLERALLEIKSYYPEGSSNIPVSLELLDVIKTNLNSISSDVSTLTDTIAQLQISISDLDDRITILEP